MNDARYDFQTSIGFLSATANRLMAASFRRNLVAAGLDLTVEQWAIVLQLHHNGGMSQEELAAVLCLEKSSMSRVLDVLERKGLIRRKRDSDDARRKLLYSTRDADILYEAAQKIAMASNAAACSDISDEDLAVTVRTLIRIKQTLQEKAR